MERKPRPRADRGMSPARTGDFDEDYERSPLVWFSRKYRLRNFYFVFIFHFDFVVRVSISMEFVFHHELESIFLVGLPYLQSQ